MQTTEKWSCGISKIMDDLSGKWRLNIIWIISNQPDIGFNQLRRNLPNITNMALERSLDALQTKGYISKELIGHKPPLQSKYCLTIKSKNILPVLLKLNNIN